MKKSIHIVLFVLVLAGSMAGYSQHDIRIVAGLDPKTHTLEIQQQITYKNESGKALDTIFLMDWSHSFSSKTTPLASRFAYDFKSNFHFEKEEDRGRTLLHSISDTNLKDVPWTRSPAQDILYVVPEKPLAPNEETTINLVYEVKIPDAKFTRFGHYKNGDYSLRYWFIAPAVYKNGWKAYSNKNLQDFYMAPSNFRIAFTAPKDYSLVSDLDKQDSTTKNGLTTTVFSSKNRTDATLYLQKESSFEVVKTDDMEVWTSIDDKGLYPPLKAIQIDRILKYLQKELGPYPFKKMVISDEDYQRNPAYGLNQLPSFIRPFPDGFQYDIEQLKTITGEYLKNTIRVNPREEHWLQEGLHIYLMMKYTDRYYPEMKIVGNLSKIWGIRWFHAAQLEFNDQYSFMYMNTARLNLDQPLSTAKDSLIKFNAEIAGSYKAGVGLYYLNDYLEDDSLEKSIQKFYLEHAAKLTDATAFEKILREGTTKEVDWFFSDYIQTNKRIDYKIKKAKRKGDSIYVTIKNKEDHAMPFSLHGLYKKDPRYKKWITGFDSTKTIVIPADGIDRVAVDYEQIVPEFNKRNNYRKTQGLFKKPVQLRFLQDVEDPEYHQLFFMPVFEYNLYDGLTLGTKLYNKTVLAKNFQYKLEPQYGLNSQSIVGGGSLNYVHQWQNKKLYALRFGVSGNTYSYNTGLFYRRFSAYSTLSFREKHLRSNKRQFINTRFISLQRDEVPITERLEEPNYGVFNMQYVFSNVNLLKYFRYTADIEIASKFQKLYTTIEYRKLFLSNRQINIRLFAGTFLNNKEPSGSDFFSFALDRPTDYLFDHNYYGRSETTGLFSQQFIPAEGGFKSKHETPFANRWMTTLNVSTNIWRWIFVYGDAGLVNNKYSGTKAYYGSGIRLSLVADYFELFFPLYTSNGWEPEQANYDQKIRFIVTLNPETLFRLFTRRWY